MQANELLDMLTEGLSPEQKAQVSGIIAANVAKAVGGLKAQKEWESIEQERTRLLAELDGDAANGRLGARAYQKWYAENQKAITDLKTRHDKYVAKYGQDPDAANPNPNPNPNPQPANGRFYTEEELKALNRQYFQTEAAPNIANVMKGMGKLVQRHMLAGRKTEVDFDALEKIMTDRGLPLEAAYDEWDKPERERIAKETQDKEVERRVNEEIKKRQSTVSFPTGSDLSTPGALGSRTKDEINKFDRAALTRDLASTFVNAGQDAA